MGSDRPDSPPRDQSSGKSGSTGTRSDLADSPEDERKLREEIVTMDMPEVKDIPGQENITVPDFREMQDTTASSADEEAEDLLAGINDDRGDRVVNADSDVSEDEQRLLRRAAGHTANAENRDIASISLDNTDADGDELSEKSASTDRFGEDLDVPGSEDDDDNEDIGAEDEENNAYSRPD